MEACSGSQTRWPRWAGFGAQASHQIIPWTANRLVNSQDGRHQDVDFAGLDLLHRSRVNLDPLRQLLLRHATGHPLPAHIGAEDSEFRQFGLVSRHAPLGRKKFLQNTAQWGVLVRAQISQFIAVCEPIGIELGRTLSATAAGRDHGGRYGARPRFYALRLSSSPGCQSGPALVSLQFGSDARHPGGMNENSPPFQRWMSGRSKASSPGGTEELTLGRLSFAPGGAREMAFEPRHPPLEWWAMIGCPSGTQPAPLPHVQIGYLPSLNIRPVGGHGFSTHAASEQHPH